MAFNVVSVDRDQSYALQGERQLCQLWTKYIKMTSSIAVKRRGQRQAALGLLYIHQFLLACRLGETAWLEVVGVGRNDLTGAEGRRSGLLILSSAFPSPSRIV